MNTIEFGAAVCAGKGRRRKHNQDNLFFNGRFLDEGNRDDDLFFSTVEKDSRQLMYGVFDGMGGESLGEVASFLTAEVVAEKYRQVREYDELDIVSFIYDVVREANDTVCARAEEEKVRRMGTTFTTLSIQNDTAVFFNLGDSRSFLLRDGVLKQTSVDDTTVRRKIELGLITEEEAKSDIDRHKITNFIGIPPEDGGVGFHTSHKISVRKGDCFLISSDGLTDMVEEDRIAEIMTEASGPPEAANALFREAMENGGRDNITIIVVEALTGRTASGPEKTGKRESSDEPATITHDPEQEQRDYLDDPEEQEESEEHLDAFDLAFFASLMVEESAGTPAPEADPKPPARVQRGPRRVNTQPVRKENDALASRYPKRQKLDIIKAKEENRTWKVLMIITASVIAVIAACALYMNLT